MRKIIGPVRLVTMEVEGMLAAQRAMAMVVGVMLLAACGGGEPEPSPTPAPPTDPPVTAPPAVTPEEQAEAEIKATFEDLIAAWDDFKANASDYVEAAATDPAWNFSLVEAEMWMLDQAQIDFLNSTNSYLDSEIEQVGRTNIAQLEVHEVEFGTDGSANATGDACLDLSGLSFNTYEGESAALPGSLGLFQRWTFAARFLPSRGSWFVTRADVQVVEACT